MSENKKSGRYEWGKEDSAVKRMWHSIRYWWAFENGAKICGALAIGGLIGAIGGAVAMANCEIKMAESDQNRVINTAVATTIETMHLLDDISEMTAEGGENK